MIGSVAIRPEPLYRLHAFRKKYDPRICNHLSALRHREIGDHADRCLPVFLYVHRLRRDAAAEAGRLLRVLFLRLGSVPADPGRAVGWDGRRFLLWRIAGQTMSSAARAIGCGVRTRTCLRGGFLRAPFFCQPVRARPCSNRYLDCCADLDGNGVHSQCKTVRTHTLSVHRAVLLDHAHSCARAGFGGHFARFVCMDCARRRHYPRRQDHLVGDRASVGKILLVRRVRNFDQASPSRLEWCPV